MFVKLDPNMNIAIFIINQTESHTAFFNIPGWGEFAVFFLRCFAGLCCGGLLCYIVLRWVGGSLRCANAMLWCDHWLRLDDCRSAPCASRKPCWTLYRLRLGSFCGQWILMWFHVFTRSCILLFVDKPNILLLAGCCSELWLHPDSRPFETM